MMFLEVYNVQFKIVYFEKELITAGVRLHHVIWQLLPYKLLKTLFIPKIAADGTFNYFSCFFRFYLSKKIRLSHVNSLLSPAEDSHEISRIID